MVAETIIQLMLKTSAKKILKDKLRSSIFWLGELNLTRLIWTAPIKPEINFTAARGSGQICTIRMKPIK